MADKDKLTSPEDTVVKSDKVTIIVHKDPNDPTSLVVNGAVNGVNYSIKRGVKVEVSRAILESLENAKGTAYYQNGDEMQENDISSYPISVFT
jgi:microcompartment protein CcmL/EutN